MENVKKSNKRINMKLVQVAILAAISTILYLPMFSFPLPFLFPGFLELQFSNLPAIIGGFALGPLGGCLIIIIKTIFKSIMIIFPHFVKSCII